MDLGLTDKVFVVTAASAGLGLATARVLVAEGARVVLDGALISVGGPPRGAVLEMTDQEWRQSFDTVFLPALRMVRDVVTFGTADDLAIGVVLSTSVRVPLPGMAISNGLRPGLAMLIKQLADELGPEGTRILGLMPGSIETERLAELMAAEPDPEQAIARAASRIPLRRLGRPEEFGRVAAFALSPMASYVTGSMIAIDGGSLRTP